MVQKKDSVLVAVSGGPDSMVLLHALMALSDPMELQLGVAHLNHCLRQTADNDEQFVKSTAKKFGLPFFVKKKNILAEQKKTGLSIEEAGRNARYHFFNAVCQNTQFNKIAIGHHQEDNAEQILLNLIRGSGPAGIGGIPPVRENIIRPLIQSSHNERMEYLKTQEIVYVIDQSNNDERFFRNRIRHQLMPLLKSTYNPQISDTLNRLAAILKSEEEWINDLINPLFDQAVLTSNNKKTTLSVSVLLTFHLAAQRRVLRKAILKTKKNLRKIKYVHIDSIIQMIHKKVPDARFDLPDKIRIIKQADQLIIQQESQNLRTVIAPKEDKTPVAFEYLVSKFTIESESSVYISEIKSRISFSKTSPGQIRNLSKRVSFTAFFDADRLVFPITIRNFQPGDKFSPFGMTGTQKLKSFFINNKVLPSKRKVVPVFLSGDKIFWVGGFRIADPFKITAETKSVLKIEIFFENGIN
jgi:tRNA(Ile)-lysidine synthase